jgi:hypothetical protein
LPISLTSKLARAMHDLYYSIDIIKIQI